STAGALRDRSCLPIATGAGASRRGFAPDRMAQRAIRGTAAVRSARLPMPAPARSVPRSWSRAHHHQVAVQLEHPPVLASPRDLLAGGLLGRVGDDDAPLYPPPFGPERPQHVGRVVDHGAVVELGRADDVGDAARVADNSLDDLLPGGVEGLEVHFGQLVRLAAVPAG